MRTFDKRLYYKSDHPCIRGHVGLRYKRNNLCKDCSNIYVARSNAKRKNRLEYSRAYNKANKEKYSRAQREKRQKSREFVNRVKLRFGCRVCGYKKCAEAIDLHHNNPKEKEFNVAERAGNSISVLKREIRKCYILCSNCHREHHAGLLDLE